MRGRLPRAVADYRGLFDRRVWFLTAGQVVLSLGRGILMPFITLYFYNVRGFPLALIGLSLAIAFPLGSIVGLYWGSTADAVGRKPLMLLGYFSAAAMSVALAFVATIPELFVVTALQSIAFSAVNPANRAMVADVTPPGRRTRAYGLLYMANNLGLSVGLLVGGLLAVFLPYQALFFAEAGGSVAYGLVVLLFVQESHAREASAAAAAGGSALANVGRELRALSTPLHDRSFLLFGAAGVCVGLGWSQLYITFSPYLKDVLGTPDAWIGALFSINTVMVVLFQIPLSAWAERHARTDVFVVGNALLAVSLLVTWAAGGASDVGTAMAVMVLAVVVMTVGEIVNAPIGPSLVAGLAGSASDVAKYMAAFDLTWSVGTGIGAIVGGAFFDAGRPRLLFPSVAVSVLVGMVLYWRLGRVLPRDVNRPAPDDGEPHVPVPGLGD